MRLAKAWTATNRLSIIWKSDLTDKMKRSFFQAAVTSILLYGFTTWTLTKRLEKKLDGNYSRMLRAIFKNSWRPHPTRHQLYGHLPLSRKRFKLDEPDMQDTAGEAGTNSYEMYSYGPHTWPCKNRTTSTNIHSSAMWGYGMLSWRPT